MLNGEVTGSLQKLRPISLEEIRCVELMNRIETKFAFTSGKLTQLLSMLNGRYQVLEMENLRAFPYCTTYFDTPEYLFYYQHLRGEYDRHKIRYRRYEATNDSFLEIKKKTNKGRTIKYRIENEPLINSFDEQAENFLSEYLPVRSSIVKPVIINRYNRVTLVGLESKERITIDYNVTYSDPSETILIEMPYLAIVELKREGCGERSYFKNLMKQLHVYPTGLSKYCIGCAVINNSLGKNMIKQKLLMLNKIENEFNR